METPLAGLPPSTFTGTEKFQGGAHEPHSNVVSWLFIACSHGGGVFSPPSSHAIPLIQEVLYDGPGTDADDVFTEIFGIAGTSLDGWSLVGVNGSDQRSYWTVTLEGAVIPHDGILLITTFSATADLLAHRDFLGEVDWQNGPDAVQLSDSQGKIIDALQYTWG